MPGVSKETQIALIEANMARFPEHVQQHYHDMVAAGSDPVLAEMCATRHGPSMKNSDRTFNIAERRAMSNMHEGNRDNICAIAQKAGISTDGKYYVGGLGKYDDPAAWVSTADDVVAACKAKNLSTISGPVHHKGTKVPPPPKVPMAPDVMADYKAKYLAKDPGLREKVRKKPSKSRELEEKILDKHTKKPGAG